MLVFGGFDGKNQLDDLAALDTKTFEWSHPQLLAPETVSEASEGNACGQGENDDGGGDEEFDAAPVAVPAPRYQHAAVACDHGMLVYGGYLSGGEFADGQQGGQGSCVPGDASALQGLRASGGSFLVLA